MPLRTKCVCKKTVRGGSDAQEHTMKCKLGPFFFDPDCKKKQYAERGQLLFGQHRGKRERIFILSKCRALVEGPPLGTAEDVRIVKKRHYEMPTPAKSVCKKTVHGGSDGQEHTMKCHFGKSACVKRQHAEGRMLKNTL